MTWAFSNMAKGLRNEEIEAKIKISSKYMQWYLFFILQFICIPKTWLRLKLLENNSFDGNRRSATL